MNENESARTSSTPAEKPTVMTVEEAAAKHEQRQAAEAEKARKRLEKKVGGQTAAVGVAAPAKGKADKAAKAKVRAAARKPKAAAKAKPAKKAAAPKAKGERKPKGLTLRAEVNAVMAKVPKGSYMTGTEIVRAIEKRGVYKRPNGKPVSPGHIAFLAIRSPEFTYGKGGKKTNVGHAPAKK